MVAPPLTTSRWSRRRVPERGAPLRPSIPGAAPSSPPTRSSHLKRPRAILFDLDGTLVDSLTDIANAANTALRFLGFPVLSESAIRGFVGNGVRDLLERCIGGPHPRLEEGIQVYRAHYGAHALDHTRFYEGVPALLEALAGTSLAVVTNKPEGFSRSILEGLGLHRHFAQVTGGDTFGEQKPSPVPLLATLERLGVRPPEALMVGDGPQDIRAARAARIPCCGVLWGFNDRETLERERPTHLAGTVPELGALLGAAVR